MTDRQIFEDGARWARRDVSWSSTQSSFEQSLATELDRRWLPERRPRLVRSEKTGWSYYITSDGRVRGAPTDKAELVPWQIARGDEDIVKDLINNPTELVPC